MPLSRKLNRLLVITFALLLFVSFIAIAQAKRKEKKPAPSGKPILWRDPGDLRTRDLFFGPGGAGMKPDTTNVTFIKESKGGYSVK